ncbi:hypothetical protein EDB81DRAFT_910042 [Dactylonectria macrodidyma]|uniref:NAD(P)-binding protein n=1 Tax=Dactylonectria macrodidyma TaxID=307937 RepID=A0A9P9FRZ2_9HYPO|nr:hypothetical protein EDB81DRAFT_910042 [Dactylonectria macrodidyma]
MAPTTKTVFITGANTGIGYQIIRALAASTSAYTILLGSRSLEKAEAAIQSLAAEFPSTKSNVVPIQIDIENDASINAAFKSIETEYGCLDALVNNAGAQFDQQLTAGKMTMREVWDASWRVNTTSTHVMTHTFAPLLLKSSDPRLLFVTSGMSTLQDSDNRELAVNKIPGPGWPKQGLAAVAGIPAYRSSKTGMNMMMREWHRLLNADGVKVWCISPGFLATNLGGNQDANKQFGAQDPALGGTFIRSVLEGERDGDVGKVVSRAGVQPW